MLPNTVRLPSWLAGLISAALLAAAPASAGERTGPAAVDHGGAMQPAFAAGVDARLGACSIGQFENRLLDLVNRVRAAGANCGTEGNFAPARPLRWNARLADAARSHTADMASANQFQHAGLRSGRSVAQRIFATADDWGEYGENIAAGGRTPEEVIARWHRSPRHCANLMNPAFTDVGAACMQAAPTSRFETYWTLDLAGP